MEQLVERFKLISAAINLNEYEIISAQTKKLSTFSLDSRADDILKSLQKQAYDEALSKIRTYEKNASNINAYKDPKIQALHIQLRTLEKDLNNLHEEKNEYIANINEFISFFFQYYLHVELQNVLKLRLKNAGDALGQNHITRKRFEELNEKYNLYAHQLNSFTEQRTEHLSQEDSKEIKDLYKKANRTINPDILTENEKKRTQKMFDALNRAYTRRDLATVKKIQKTIEENPRIIYGFDKINDKDKLRAQSKALQLKISTLKDEIKTIKQSDIYQFLNSTDNLESYFQNIKHILVINKIQLGSTLV